MANDSDDDSFFVIVIIVLLAIIMFFMPVLMWMYMDIRQTEIKVQKLIKKLEEK
jgi:low affinity Fe/Cu permease